MTVKSETSLLSHLLRRAGFGANYDETEAYAEMGYEATVEKFLDPESEPNFDYYDFIRRHPCAEGGPAIFPTQLNFLYFLLNTKHPLEEKMALFWLHFF